VEAAMSARTAAGPASPAAIPRRPDGAPPAPLSFAQQRLWFLDRMAPSTTYNMPVAFRLDGDLRVDVLERAFERLALPHDILRTRFLAADGEGSDLPVQLVVDPKPISLPVTDLSHLGSGERARESDRLRAKHARMRFDLEAGPPWSVDLVRLE